MPQSFPADLRILNYVATVFGADDSLESINTHKVMDRAIIAVKSNDSLYMLRKESTQSPSGNDVVEPAAGPGRWFIYLAGESPTPPAVNVERIDNGNIGGSKLVDVDTSALNDGALATVVSVGALFSLVLAAPAALLSRVDGITIVQSDTNPASVWVRRPGNDPSFAATPPLYIDPTLGSDDNDGQLSTTALRTADEWCRRMNDQIVRTPFTVTCAAGDIGNFGLCRIGEDSASAPVFITVQGAESLSAEVGTISSVTAQNDATGQEFIFLDSSGVGPVIPDGARLQIVSSAVAANVGGVGYVKGFGAGGATNPYTTTWTSVPGIGFFPQAGDTYVVSTPTTTVRSFDTQWINQYSPGPSVGGFAFTDLLVQTERFAQYQITSNELIGNASFSSYFINCVFNDILSTNFARCNFRTYGCEFKVPVNVILGTVSFHSACFRAGLAVATSGAVDLTAGPCCFDGAASIMNIASTGVVVNSTNVCFSRVSNSTGAIIVQGGGRLLPTDNLWTPPPGARNTLSYGVQIYAGGNITTNFFYHLSGVRGSIYNVVSEVTSEVQQFTIVENNLSGVMDRTLANGGLMLLKDIATGAGGAIPTVSPSLGSERFSSSGGQFARSRYGGLSTVVPAGGPNVANRATLSSLRCTSPTVQTAGAVAGTILQYSTAVPLISGSLNNLGMYVEATFTGYDATGGAVVTTKVSRSFKKVSGTLTALGAQAVISPVAGDAALLAATVSLNAAGIVIQGQATGVAGVTLNWVCHFEIWSTEFVG